LNKEIEYVSYLSVVYYYFSNQNEFVPKDFVVAVKIYFNAFYILSLDWEGKKRE